MRHFMGYNADGVIASLESYSPGGWPSICENCTGGCEGLADTACKNPSVVSLRTKRADKNPEIVGFIAYDCPCPSTAFGCEGNHQNDWTNLHYVDVATGEWVKKPGVSLTLDGQPVAGEDELINKEPGTTSIFKIIAPSVPDGENLVLGTFGPFDIVDGPDLMTVEINNGESEDITFYAPAHGIKVMVGVSGKWTPVKRFQFRGWPVV